jgi:ATP-dependent DNA helicase RecG
MNNDELTTLLERLVAVWENEVIEFKQASHDYSTHDIGKYFSALSNEANLCDKESGWLVFGVKNTNRTVLGTDYRPNPERLQGLKMQISENTEPNVTLRNIYELNHTDGRVVLFEIPAAPMGMPISWKGHYYSRSGESLTSLGLEKQDEIRNQTISEDWSCQIVSDAKTSHLDDTALQTARANFARKHANSFTEEEVANWSTETFLQRCKLSRDDKLTRATILLLGKPESAHLLTPHPAQLTWKLDDGDNQAYEHFGPPFLLNTTALYNKVRNFQIRILPDDALLPVEVSKYDQKIVLEALHNCIAHQDYRKNGRVIVMENGSKLVFENEGSFFEGKPEDYLMGEKTPRKYRNPFLAQAMAELNMIDTMGYGIHRMNEGQAKRYLPLPDYDLSGQDSVKMNVYSQVVDASYSRLLIQKTDLPLDIISALDRVQKRILIPDDMLTRLRRAKLVEGRKPNIHISATIAQITGIKAKYIKTRTLDDNYCIKLVKDYLEKFNEASRRNIDDLLRERLGDILDEKQKTNKITNLMSKMKKQGIIVKASGVSSDAIWKLAGKTEQKHL